MDERIEKLRERVREAFSGYTELAGGRDYRYHHSVSVMKLSLKLLDNLGADAEREVLAAGALLHDIGRTEDIEEGFLDPMSTSEGHAGRGVPLVKDYAGDLFSDGEIERIESIVGNHDSEPGTAEGMIVKDADMLDVYGVSNFWRMFHYSCEKGRSFEDEIGYFWDDAVPGMSDMLEDFNFDISRKVAERRLERQIDAFEQILAENSGEDISRSI